MQFYCIVHVSQSCLSLFIWICITLTACKIIILRQLFSQRTIVLMGFFFTHTIFYSWLICLHFLRDSCWTCYLCWSCFSMTPPGITIMSNPGTLNGHIYFTIPFLYTNKQNHTKTFHWLKSIQILHSYRTIVFPTTNPNYMHDKINRDI